ncbi:MAG: hypothetical protein AAGB18_00130 [Pseudomonadota bacterium]
MTRPKTPHRLGATILLGLAAGTLPMAGCAIIGQSEATEEISAEEQRDFEAAVTQNDPVFVERYLRRYPNGRVASVLSAQSPEVISRLAPNAFANVPAETIRTLPPSIRQNLPASVSSRAPVAREQREDSGDRSEDTYSG